MAAEHGTAGVLRCMYVRVRVGVRACRCVCVI